MSLRNLSPWGILLLTFNRGTGERGNPCEFDWEFPHLGGCAGKLMAFNFPLLCRFERAFQMQLMENSLICRSGPFFWPAKAKIKNFSSSLSLLSRKLPTFQLFPLQSIAQVLPRWLSFNNLAFLGVNRGSRPEGAHGASFPAAPCLIHHNLISFI